jgi:hypothetical protein
VVAVNVPVGSFTPATGDSNWIVVVLTPPAAAVVRKSIHWQPGSAATTAASGAVWSTPAPTEATVH